MWFDFKKSLFSSILIPSVIVILALLMSLSAMAESIRVGHLKVELVSEVTAIVPGQPFWVAVYYRLDPHWHIYWRNPGDAGIPPEIEWSLPDGFRVGEIQWPVPELISQPPLAAYGYYDSVLLMLEIYPPNELDPDDLVVLKANSEWLVCKEKCIPGETKLTLSLTVSSEAATINSKWSALFADTRNKLPIELGDWQIKADTIDDGYIIYIDQPEWYADSTELLAFYPYDKLVIDYSADQEMITTDSSFKLHLKKSMYQMKPADTLRGILINLDGWRGEGSETALAVNIPVGGDGTKGPIAVATTDKVQGLWFALLFAFLGGMILNLMPCVLPVLSIKILSFVQQANEHKGRSLSNSFIFALGILVTFWILAGTLIVLRMGGEQLGWGFQLQSPIFLIVLASFIFLFGLSLLGVFEIGSSLTRVGSLTRSRSGHWSSFFSGVTAVVVATPCTAPFMGSALGYALSQPPVVSLAIFSSLGLGLAFPYVALSSWPGLMRFVPRPGKWMETMKQAMGFLLMATVVWLIWVLAIQTGASTTAFFLLGLVMLAVGGWMWGRWGTPIMARRVKLWAGIFSVGFLLAGFSLGMYGLKFTTLMSSESKSGDGLAWESFSQQRLDQLLANNQPVFVDFTAAWCLSCQVNEQIALETSEVIDRFKDLGISMLKADWTSYNEEITRALAGYGRNSVPLYVLYYGDGSEAPMILPEILTPGLVLEALDKINN